MVRTGSPVRFREFLASRRLWHHVGVGEIELARATLDEAHRTFVENLRGVSLDEALNPAGGYRSILGVAKHAAAWSAVYYSYAFESHR
jgi:hypothetical protein